MIVVFFFSNTKKKVMGIVVAFLIAIEPQKNTMVQCCYLLLLHITTIEKADGTLLSFSFPFQTQQRR
jgi:hypothetical protein